MSTKINTEYPEPRKKEESIPLYYIVSDAVKGRKEVSVDAGEIQLCVGDRIEADRFGRRTRVPVYATRRF